MKKILIIRLSSIGDVILTTPLIRAVKNKYPNAQIDFVIKDIFADVVRTNLYLNNLYVYSKKENNLKEIKQKIKAEKYDLIIDIHKNFRSLYLRFGSGAKKTVHHKKYILIRTLLVKWKINLFKEIIPSFKRYFNAVKSLEIEYDGLGTDLIIPKENTDNIKKILVKDGKEENQLFVALCPGASFDNKRWKPEGFAEVADYLIKEKNAFIGFLGGKEDLDLCHNIKNLMDSKSFNYAGKFKILESAALLKESDMVITNDTGLMHIAQTQKKPVIAIFGPTTKELGYFPLPEKSSVVEYDISCRPCTHIGLHDCPKSHFKCMNEISSQQIIKAVDELLVSENLCRQT